MSDNEGWDSDKQYSQPKKDKKHKKHKKHHKHDKKRLIDLDEARLLEEI